MAFNLGDILVNFKANTDDLKEGIASVKSGVAGLQTTVNNSNFGGWASKASTAFGDVANGIQSVVTKAALLATATTIGGAQFVNLAGDLQTAQQRMASLAGDTEAAKKAFGELYNYTLGKPIAFPDAAKAAQTLMGYGVSVNSVVPAMKTLSAFSVVNGADLQQLALAYGQVNAKGKLMGQEIIQLTNNFVPVSQIIAKHFNVSIQQAQALMEGGTISAQDFNAAMSEFIPQDKIEQQTNTFKNRLISLQGSIRSFGLALLGVHVDPALGLVVEPGGLFDRLSGFLPVIAAKLKELKPAFVAGMGWLLDHGSTIIAIVEGIGGAFVFAKIGSWVTGLVALGAAFLYNIGLINAATAAMLGFDAAADANPIGAIVLALTALVGVITYLQVKYDILGKTIQALKGPVDALVTVLHMLWDTFTGGDPAMKAGHDNLIGLQKVLTAVADVVRPLIHFIGQQFTDAWASLGRIASQTATLLKPVFDAIGSFFVQHKDVIMTVLKYLAIGLGAAVLGPIITTLGALAIALKVIATVLDFVADHFKGIVQIIKGVFIVTLFPLISTIWLLMETIKILGGVFSTVFGVLATVFSAIFSAIMAAWNAVGKPIFDAIAFVLNALFTIWWTVFSSFYQIVWTIFSTIAQIIFVILQGIFNFVVNQIIMPLYNIWVAVWSAIYNFVVNNVLIPMYNFFAAIFNGIYNAVAPVLQRMWATISAIFGGIWNTITGVVSSLYSWVAGMFGGISGSITGAMNGALGWLRGVGGAFVDAGRNIINGLVAGVQGGAGAVVQKIKDICASALNAVKSFFGIHSPSKVMEQQIGGNMMAGWGAGLVNGVQKVVASAKNAAGQVLNGFQDLATAGTATLSMTASAGVLGGAIAAAPVVANANNGNNGPVQATTNVYIDSVDQTNAEYVISKINRNQELAARGIATQQGSVGTNAQ